jgi:hypothetical protein
MPTGSISPVSRSFPRTAQNRLSGAAENQNILEKKCSAPGYVFIEAQVNGSNLSCRVYMSAKRKAWAVALFWICNRGRATLDRRGNCAIL